MSEWVTRYLQRLRRQAGMDGRRRGLAVGHLEQLLLDSGGIFVLLGALVFMHQLTTSAAASSNAEQVFLFFLLWLLGTALVMLSVVAREFPRLAVAVTAVATAFHGYLLGGV